MNFHTVSLRIGCANAKTKVQRPSICQSWALKSEFRVLGRKAAMDIPAFIMDAFSNLPFKGNPAAVCLLQKVS